MMIETTQKHAYLIIAHNNFEQLQVLVSLLDDPRNDIYLHIDKKAVNFSPEMIKAQRATVFFVDSISVTWGGHSQIACEMLLFKAAAPKHYLYYHLLSGIDLPLKTQDEIHAFFCENQGKNYIAYNQKDIKSRVFVSRTQYYHFFRNFRGDSSTFARRALRVVSRKLVSLQRMLHIKRKEIIPLYKGSNWVSITDDMVHYVLSCEKLIKKQFYYSSCGDEVFLQSVAMQSPYRDTIMGVNYRAVDWERGRPYTYRKEDVPQLLASPNLFARKFVSAVDDEAVRLVVEHVSRSV